MQYFELKEKGNLFFQSGEFSEAIECYISAIDVSSSVKPETIDSILTQIACHSNLATSYSNIGQFKLAETATTEGLSLIHETNHLTASESEYSEKINKIKQKLLLRLSYFDNRRAVINNSINTRNISPTNPTNLHLSPLKAMLTDSNLKERKTLYFFESQYMSYKYDNTVRFLATIHVLTCISVFGWYRDELTHEILGFGAHINMGSLLYSVYSNMQKLITNQPFVILPELVQGLNSAFENAVDKRKVRIFVVGGHKAMDLDKALCQYFPGNPEKHSFSSLVLECIANAGFSNIDTSLLNKFEGVACISSNEIERQLCEENQRFVLAALDLEMGLLVTHTEDASQFEILPRDSDIRRYERDVVSKLVAMGATLERVTT